MANYLPPFAVILHDGIVSGKRYRTPVFAFLRAGEMIVVLSYGRESQWVRNLQARGRGGVIRAGRRSSLANIRVVPVAEGGRLSPLGRFAARMADHLLVADIVPTFEEITGGSR